MYNYALLFIILLTLSILQLDNFNAYAGTPLPWNIEKYDAKINALKALNEKPAPMKQIKDGILIHDVLCSTGLVPILAWSDNKIACVKPDISDKLFKLGWGVPSEKASISDGSICFGYFEIHYEDSKKFDKLTIIHSLRNFISGIDNLEHSSKDKYKWNYIQVYDTPDTNGTLAVSVNIFGLCEIASQEQHDLSDVLGKIGATNFKWLGTSWE